MIESFPVPPAENVIPIVQRTEIIRLNVSSSSATVSTGCHDVEKQSQRFPDQGINQEPSGQISELLFSSTHSADSDEFNRPNIVSTDSTNCRCCGVSYPGALRVVYRHRLNVLIRVKAIAGFIEMFIAMIVMFLAPDNVCNTIRYWILAWVIRLPLEMPLLSERLQGDHTQNKFMWYCTIVWNVGWFGYGNYLMATGSCYNRNSYVYCGLCSILGVTYVCAFINWPFVAVFVHEKISTMKPILPHLPHTVYEDHLKNNEASVEEEDSCVICMNLYEPRNIITTLPCVHYFHQSCINTWLENHNTCPMCRANVPDDGWVQPNEPRFNTLEEQLAIELAVDQEENGRPEYQLP